MSFLRLGTRGSPLALWQAERVRSALGLAGCRADLLVITTTGDLDRSTPLGRLGQPAVFSRELDEALLDRRIDLAVHSLKDLPTDLPAGIALAAVSTREDARDALIGRHPMRWADLPRGATVATSSLRRQAQIRRARPDLQVTDLRGNIGTRLEKLDQSPDWAAIVLAAAGLVRLGLGARIGERLPLDLMLPAPGQGALAVSVRADDAPVFERVRAAVNDARTEIAVTAERSLLRTLEGGCHVPVAAYAWFERDQMELSLRARVVSLDGTDTVESAIRAESPSPTHARELGETLARQLLADGAAQILRTARRLATARPR